MSLRVRAIAQVMFQAAWKQSRVSDWRAKNTWARGSKVDTKYNTTSGKHFSRAHGRQLAQENIFASHSRW